MFKMKTFALLVSLLAMTASAVPEATVGEVTEGEHTYRGLAKSLVADNVSRQCSCGLKCYAVGDACKVYKCQCAGQAGCYSCNGGPYVCQPGPGSGKCIN
ncbi:hypothetical protein E4U41_003986 [Claviceps citrina]|nr:hypothetical protein E4U41_003986 [Claviceps citrina]